MDIYGFEETQPVQLPGSAYWIEEDLYLNIIDAILKQLKRAGFKIVVAHGHGPSTNLFREHIAEWSKKYNLKLFICWREEVDGLGIQTDHAGANETSLMMALYPELVKMHQLDYHPKRFPVGVSGKDPRLYASSEIGEKAIRLQLERMKNILEEELIKLEQGDLEGMPDNIDEECN